jgi:hypothetical protein
MADSVWREFFDSYAPQYMNEAFTADRVREVELLAKVLDLPAGATILDEWEIMVVMRRPAA